MGAKVKKELFDVVIYHMDTREVVSVAGKDMRFNGGFHNAEKRLETVISRIGDDYNASIVPAGKFRTGDVLPET